MATRQYHQKYYQNNREKIISRGKEYYNNHIKEKKEYDKNYRQNNKEKISKRDKEYKLEYRKKNKESIKIKNKIYRQNNKEKIKRNNDKYRELNYEKIKERNKIYRQNNKEKIKEYEINRTRTNVEYRLTKRLRTRLGDAIKNNQKSGSAIGDLGCSIEELKQYLERKFKPGMSWNNWSHKGWHIDHIIPLSSFELSDKTQLQKACHYTNLQPLWAKENLIKSNKYEI